MRCALALSSNAAFEGIFRVQVLESAGIDRHVVGVQVPAPTAALRRRSHLPAEEVFMDVGGLFSEAEQIVTRP